MDGTLTVPMHDFDSIRRDLGVPEGRYILEYLDELPESTAAPLHQRLADLEHSIALESRPAHGAVEAIHTLNEAGHCLGVLTRNSRANALTTLAAIGIESCFEIEDIIGRDEAAPKPSPDGIHLLIGRWGAAAENCMMVGDYRFDLEAGRRAGTRTAHFWRDDTPTWPELTDIRVSSLTDLIAPHLQARQLG